MSLGREYELLCTMKSNLMLEKRFNKVVLTQQTLAMHIFRKVSPTPSKKVARLLSVIVILGLKKWRDLNEKVS